MYSPTTPSRLNSSEMSLFVHTSCFCGFPLNLNHPNDFSDRFHSALDLYSASDYLPKALTDPVLGPSYAVEETAFQLAVGTKKPRWEWLEEKIPAGQTHFERNGYPRNVKGVNGTNGVNGKRVHEDSHKGNGAAEDCRNGTAAEIGNVKPRPELEIFGLAMLGGGRVFGTAHIYGPYHRSDLIRCLKNHANCHQTSLGLLWVMELWLMSVVVSVSVSTSFMTAPF
jgi:hypothetical protein